MSPVPLEDLSILIVDDEPGALSALGDIFEELNYRVTRAASGQEARQAIREKKFDVALLDIRLPDARGTDLLKEVRQASDTTRCIMVTASSEAEDAINALNDGASAYITKPVDVAGMISTINDVVSKYRQNLEERRSLRELDVVKAIGDVAMGVDLNGMISEFIRVAVNGFDADCGAILLCDAFQQTLQGEAQVNLTPEPIDEYIVPVGEGFEGRVAANREVQRVEDVTKLPYALSPQLEGVKSILGAPILDAKGLLGVLIIAWRAPRAFTRDDVHLVGVIAQRIGLATANARLYVKEDASRQRAEFLARVSQELNVHIEDESDVVDRVTRLAAERLGDGCAIFLLRPDADTLEVVRSYHSNPATQELFEGHLRDRPLQAGEGNVGRVARTGVPIVSGPEGIAAYPHRPYLADVGIRSTMSVPLGVRGEIIGVMSVSVTGSDRRYTEEDLSLAREFAERASVAIENARLLRESHEKQEELQALNEMTRVVTRSLKEAEVLESLLHGTTRMLDVPACFIATMHPDRGLPQVNKEYGISAAAAAELAAVCLRTWRAKMLQGREPFSVEDLQAVSVADVAECARRHGVRSMFSVPFEVEGQYEGALVALTHAVDPDLARKRPLMSTLGGLAGVAISNARSFNREHRIAHDLQEWILSTEANVDLGEFEVAKKYQAALNEANVGGDFYDMFSIGPDQVGIVIGDVSGKGLEAALHTQAVKHTLRAYALSAGTTGTDSTSPREVLARTNDAICFMLPTDVFITLFYGVVNVPDRSIRYANAGHDAPILCRHGGGVEMLESTGRALGLLTGAVYDEVEVRFQPGDAMLLYTDGVTEARCNGRFLETEGVVDLLMRHACYPAEQIVQGVFEATSSYADKALHDDIALLAIRLPLEAGSAEPAPGEASATRR